MESISENPATPDLAAAMPAPAQDAADKPQETNTHFTFKHRIFSLPECRFARNGADKMPCFYIPMGEQVAAIELAKLQQEFNIPGDSLDALLLKKVEKGLNHVKEIRPYDSIPREILDGSASWTVEERHHAMALARFNQELLFWITGFREEFPPLTDMQQTQASAEGLAQLQEAHTRLAQQLHIKPDLVRSRIHEIVREMAYIEALRERSHKIGEISQKLAAFSTALKKEPGIVSEMLRMQDLIRRASKLMNEKLTTNEQAFKEIVKTLHTHRQVIETIRATRDWLHVELKKWDDYFILWDGLKLERNEEAEKVFRKFYRFLAENYIEQQSWGAGGGKKR